MSTQKPEVPEPPAPSPILPYSPIEVPDPKPISDPDLNPPVREPEPSTPPKIDPPPGEAPRRDPDPPHEPDQPVPRVEDPVDPTISPGTPMVA